MIVCPAPSAAIALLNTSRLLLRVMPTAATRVDDATLAQLNAMLSECVAVIATKTDATNTTDKRTELVLTALARGSVTDAAGAVAVDHHSRSTVSAGSSVGTITVDADWKSFMNSEAILRLEDLVREGLDTDPQQIIPVISKVARCRFPVVKRLLHNLSKLPGLKHLSRVSEVRSSIPLAISYALVTVADVTSDTHTLKIIEGLEGFELSHNMCEQIMTPKFRQLNPHSLLYQLALKRLPASATMKNVAKERWWADYLTNSSVAK